MKCPKCGNDYCNMTSDKKVTGTDYSVSKGLLGEALFGASGYICGISDSRKVKVDVYWVCKKCGYRFKR